MASKCIPRGVTVQMLSVTLLSFIESYFAPFDMTVSDRFEKAITTFDAYNLNDPHQEEVNGKLVSKEVLYSQRMSQRLNDFYPAAPEYLRLAAHCQHIGRWEISRESYSMDKKGYLQWRNVLKIHHAKLAEQILNSCRYDQATIDKVKFLLVKKELFTNPDTQVLEDVICLVFVEYYLEEFAEKHEHHKVVEILQKTLRKMTPRAREEAGRIQLSSNVKLLLQEALSARTSAT